MRAQRRRFGRDPPSASSRSATSSASTVPPRVEPVLVRTRIERRASEPLGVAHRPGGGRGFVDRRIAALVAARAEAPRPARATDHTRTPRWIVDELERTERAFEVRGGRFEREVAPSRARRRGARSRRPCRVAGQRAFAEVVGELVEMRVEVRREARLEDLADLPVHPHPAIGAELLVQRRAHERVRERVPARRRRGTSRIRPCWVASSSTSNSASPAGPPAASMVARSNNGPITAATDERPVDVLGEAGEPPPDDLADPLGDADAARGRRSSGRRVARSRRTRRGGAAPRRRRTGCPRSRCAACARARGRAASRS